MSATSGFENWVPGPGSFSGFGGGSSTNIAPTTAKLTSYGATQTFVGSPGGGAFSLLSGAGSVNSTSGVYTAPSSGAATTGTVRYIAGTSLADAVVTLAVPVVVTVSPSTASVSSGGTQAFTATYTGSGTPTLTWDDGGAGGSFSPTTGSSTTYTAPTGPLSVTVTCTPSSPSGTAGTSAVTVASPGPAKPSTNWLSVPTSWSVPGGSSSSLVGGQPDPDGGNNASQWTIQSSSIIMGTLSHTPISGNSYTVYLKVKVKSGQGTQSFNFSTGTSQFASGMAGYQRFTVPDDGAWHVLGATWTANSNDTGTTPFLGFTFGGQGATGPDFNGIVYVYDGEYGPT